MKSLSHTRHMYAQGGTQYKTLRGCAAKMGSKTASWYMNDPLENAKFGRWMGWFFKIFQNCLKFKKIFENRVILLKIFSKIGPIGIWMGHFFPEKLVFEWV